jgi:diphthine-ammonia ligase
VPCSLTIPEPQSLPTEISLVSQHADRIVKALSTNAGGGWDGHAQLILYWLTQEPHIPYAVAAAQTLDVSEPQKRRPISSIVLRPKKNPVFLNTVVQRDTTPTLFLTVKGLPKDALIEKQVLYHTGRVCADDDEDGDTAPVSYPPIYSSGISQLFPIHHPYSPYLIRAHA